MKKKYLLILLSFVFIFTAFRSLQVYLEVDNPRINKLISQLEKFTKRFPQERVYFTIDKNQYAVNERIRIKANVLNQHDNRPKSISRNLYVELIDWRGKIVKTKLLEVKNGSTHGDFLMNDSLLSGNYQIRAYTAWMNNFDKNYILKRYLFFENDSLKELLRSDKHIAKKLNKKYRKKLERFDFQLFPEGGNLLEGVKNTIAFKANDKTGRGVAVQGIVKDKAGNEVARFESLHAGMGRFSFTPEAGKKYVAYCQFANGKKKKYKLPTALETGYVLHIDNSQDADIQIDITTNRQLFNDKNANTVYLIAQLRGKIYSLIEKNLKSDSLHFSVSRNLFPTGVVQFTLFDYTGLPHCERLVFINRHDQLKLKIEQPKTSYKLREKVSANLLISSTLETEDSADVCVAVVRKNLKTLRNTENILSYALLTADLNGKVESPDYYFENDDAKMPEALDNLMLTQGWRRFLWTDFLQNKFPARKHKIETDISVSGKITKEVFDIPANGARVTLTILNQYNDFFVDTSQQSGKFAFHGLDYKDTIDVFLEARSRGGKKWVVIHVDTAYLPKINFEKAAGITNEKLKKYATKRVPKIDPRYENNNYSKIYATPDFALNLTESDRRYSSLRNLLRGRVPGVEMSNNQVIIRGRTSLMNSNEPLYLLDGTPTGSDVLDMSPIHVERVEILKGPSASIFGSRGGNGVIAVYTRSGEMMRKGELHFKMLGYAQAKAFYMPNYDKSENTNPLPRDGRTTLYWNPSLKVKLNESTKIEWFNSAEKGIYLIYIEAVSPNGKLGYVGMEYEVK